MHGHSLKRTFLSLHFPHPLVHSGSCLAGFIVKLRFPRAYLAPYPNILWIFSFLSFFVSCECRFKTILVSAISVSDHLLFFFFESEAMIKSHRRVPGR